LGNVITKMSIRSLINYDTLRIDKALQIVLKSDNNNKNNKKQQQQKNNVLSTWDLPRPKRMRRKKRDKGRKGERDV